VPLLRRRAEFSGTDRFHLYDALHDGGHPDENVYAYSNGSGDSRSLVLVHHHFGETTVRIDHSVSAAKPGGGGPKTSVRLADALELHGPGAPADDVVIRLWDRRSGWELKRTAAEFRREGLRVTLGAYEARVLSIDIDRPMAAPDEPTEPATTGKAAKDAPGKPGGPGQDGVLSGPGPRLTRRLNRRSALQPTPRRRPGGGRSSAPRRG
jgi:hypothetical protein